MERAQIADGHRAVDGPPAGVSEVLGIWAWTKLVTSHCQTCVSELLSLVHFWVPSRPLLTMQGN